MARKPKLPDVPNPEPTQREKNLAAGHAALRERLSKGERLLVNHVYTAEEVRRQIDFVEGLMTLGASTSAVIAQATKPAGGPGTGGLGISKHRTKLLVQRVQARWEEEDRERSTSRRTEAARRILRQIQNCQGRRDPRNPNVWIEKPNHTAIVRYEELLSKLQGTQAPIEIDLNVQHSETLIATFARYSVEHLQALHAKAQAKKRLAAAYLEEHPEAREAIEAEGVTVG